MAVPPRARPPVARPAYGRPLQPVRRPAARPVPRHHPHHQHRRHRSGFTPRSLLLGLLVLATIGAGVWWFALRGTPAPSRDFVRVEERFTAAARVIPESTYQVTHIGALLEWNAGVDEQLALMQRELMYLRTIVTETEGRARRTAKESVQLATEAYALAENFRYEINAGKSLNNASNANLGMQIALDKLDAQARAWKTP